MTAGENVSAKAAKILVVDDDVAGRLVKARTLRAQGYQVAEAAGGEAAVALCRAETPDLLVLDTPLADLSGDEVCRRAKAARPDLAVLTTSASPQHATSVFDAASDTDAFLAEPVGPEELVATVRALLRMRRAEQALLRADERIEALVAERSRELLEANRRLRMESIERRKAEEVLWHAQKLEAVGQLTGGIAHDFNNLLSVMVGSLDMIRASVEGRRQYPRERLLRLISAAETAADRSAKLTQQLLAFARRSVMSFDTVIVNDLLLAADGLLRRALGGGILFERSTSQDLWPCRIDPVQFDAAIINLAINARDAMTEGGRFRIATSNIEIAGGATDRPEAGGYVRIEVTDTGCGMPPEVAKRAFEPFFTTKEIGHGTGLGLSQVYGFVKQSGGSVTLHSVPGRGTTVDILLPRTLAPTAVPVLPPLDDTKMPGGHETVLVVEDNPEVLALAVMTLKDLGYRVISAGSGPGALAVVGADEPVDVLFSDITMPGGINGFELVRAARAIRPGLRALLTSGYADVLRGSEASAIPILIKPYARIAFAQQLRMVLDTPAIAS